MLRNYLKITLRNLLRNRIYSFINISGLAIGMACSILILLWVWDEMSFDKFNEKEDQIYRVLSDWEKWDWDGLPISPEPLGPAIIESVPEVNKMFRILEFGRAVFKYKNNIFYENKGVIVDPAIFKMFSFPFTQGNPNTALSTPESIVISERFAEKYFGTENPIGKVFEVDGKVRNVTGVYKNLPQNSHLQFDFALNFEFIKEYSNYGTGWGAFNFTTYVLINKSENTNISFIGEKITKAALDQECGHVKEGVTFRLQPLKEIHLYPFGWEPSYARIGDKTQVYVFTLIAVFILLIACVNFMNLSTARSNTRAKEIGLRKTVGAMKKQLIWQFLSESLIMTILAFLFAIMIVELTLPGFNSLSGKSISTDYTNFTFVGGIIATMLLTGIISGSYPALYLSSFKPVRILKKGFKAEKGNRFFRKSLVVFQFSLSVALIFITVIIYQQIEYSKNMKLGYNKENVMYIPLIENLQSKYTLMKNSLLKNSSIKGVSAHRYNMIKDPTPRAAGFKWEGMQQDREKDLDLIWSGVDLNYFEMLNIRVVNGRLFSQDFSTDKNGVILNEAAIEEMNLDNPIGKWISIGDWKKTIIGVAEDVHYRSTRQKIDPRVYYLSDFNSSAKGIMVIKIDGSKTAETIVYVEDQWNKINSVSPFEYGFLNEDYESLYKSEITLSTIFKYFTVLAILISCLGLFGLSLFAGEQKRKEIGIRKVLGASVPGIVLQFSKEFTLWVIISNIIAWPAAYYFMSDWLSNFAYKVEIGIIPFVITGIFALLIALFTISYQAVKSALSNPVESLRYE